MTRADPPDFAEQGQLELGSRDLSWGKAGGLGITERTLQDLARHHAVVRGRGDHSEAEQAAAWRAIILSFPELLDAARAGITRKPQCDQVA